MENAKYKNENAGSQLNEWAVAIYQKKNSVPVIFRLRFRTCPFWLPLHRQANFVFLLVIPKKKVETQADVTERGVARSPEMKKKNQEISKKPRRAPLPDGREFFFTNKKWPT